MTENEAISAIQNDLEWHSKELKPKYKKVLEYAIQALEKVQQFEAIGTIEEFKAYKLGDCMNDCEHYENCSNYIYSKGYNKAIDDFVKEIEAEYDNDGCPNVTDYLDYKISIRDLHKIADQLKGGAV